MDEKLAKIGDELNQCLQIITTNAGNISDAVGPESSIREDAEAIENAVDRAAKTVRSLASLEQPRPAARGGMDGGLREFLERESQKVPGDPYDSWALELIREVLARLTSHDAALKASMREECVDAAMEAFGHNETNLPHSEGCIACNVKAAILALTHTEKASQPRSEYDQCHSDSPFCEKCGICHTEKFPCKQTEGKQP